MILKFISPVNDTFKELKRNFPGKNKILSCILHMSNSIPRPQKGSPGRIVEYGMGVVNKVNRCETKPVESGDLKTPGLIRRENIRQSAWNKLSCKTFFQY